MGFFNMALFIMGSLMNANNTVDSREVCGQG